MHNEGRAQQLIDGLTSRQLAGLVARFLDRMSITDRAKFSDTLDPDVAAVFRRLFDPPPAGAAEEEVSGRRTSDAKFAAQFQSMLSQHCRLNPCPARLEWLGRTDVANLTTGGLGFVQRNMARLIPSPETMSGDYEAAAGWLAAAREVAPGIAIKTLHHWRIDYKRRRNLWRNLSKHGVDMALGGATAP